MRKLLDWIAFLALAAVFGVELFFGIFGPVLQ